MNLDTTEQTLLFELRYLLRNQKDIVETAVATSEGGRIDAEADLRLQESAKQIDESVSDLQLPMLQREYGDEASRLYHHVLRATRPYDGLREDRQLRSDCVASVTNAIREVEDLARLIGPDKVVDSREERSKPTSLSKMMKRLGIVMDERTFKKWAKEYDLRNEGNRQRWSIRLDLLLSEDRER